MASTRLGVIVLGLVIVPFAFGCQSQGGSTRHDAPSQAGSPGQQGTMDGHSPMEHDKGGDRMIK
jgi:hypothetical protein